MYIEEEILEWSVFLSKTIDGVAKGGKIWGNHWWTDDR
jgi:hypothetical protein